MTRGVKSDENGYLTGVRDVARVVVIPAPVYRAVDGASGDAYVLAHLGRGGRCHSGRRSHAGFHHVPVDANPTDRSGSAEMLARRTRAVVETAVEEAITRTGRALGAGPLALDGPHARHVADLITYVRQSHAEGDLATLGRLAGARR
jgi:hypothetical protein